MIKTYKYKLYGLDNGSLNRQINIACYIYNHCIALHKRYYRIYHKSLSTNKLQKHLSKKRNSKYGFWKQLNSQTIQDITQRIQKGYQLFFNLNKKKSRCSPPSFKSKQNYKSITFKQTGFKLLENNKISIMGKVYRYFKSRNIGGKIKRLTIKRDRAGDLFLFFTVEEDNKKIKAKTGKIAGFDFGLTDCFLISSDEADVKMPFFFKDSIKTIRKMSRNLSSKKTRSNNRKRARLCLAKEHRKIENRRTDFHFKLAHSLLRKYDVLCFEDLNMKWMQIGHGKKVGDLGFSSFINILQHVSKKYEDKKIVFVDRFFASSKTCSACGFVKEDLELRDRDWVCSFCGTNHDRDRNASYNILRAGTSAYEVGNRRFDFPERGIISDFC